MGAISQGFCHVPGLPQIGYCLFSMARSCCQFQDWQSIEDQIDRIRHRLQGSELMEFCQSRIQPPNQFRLRMVPGRQPFPLLIVKALDLLEGQEILIRQASQR
ncbi:MAG: hypothetical protein JW394_0514 [Nitrospira sp.]|nr:hypothetical protein [Nitrospira sp.]